MDDEASVLIYWEGKCIRGMVLVDRRLARWSMGSIAQDDIILIKELEWITYGVMTFGYLIGNHDGAIERIPEISHIYPESDKRTGHRIVGARYHLSRLSGKLAVATSS